MSEPAAPAAGALPSAAAGLAVTLTATSLTGVLTGPSWWGFVVLTIAVVVVAGVLLRSLRLPAILVATGQLATLAGLVTAVFTRSGVLGVLPGPQAVREVGQSLVRAAQQGHAGVPPVPESTELLCLVVVALGLVAITVDTVAVSAAAPAAAGLVLLCVVAVPASLSDHLLPWWTFLLGAVGFALLLTVDSRRRHLVWGEPAGPGGHIGAVPAAVAVGACATVLALLAGSALTGVGTAGRLSSAGDGRGDPADGIGLNPFTSLRGQLDAPRTTELFRVRGLPQGVYLRALTLDRFVNGQGWRQGPLEGVVQASGGAPAGSGLPLPNGVAEPLAGPPVQVRIEPTGYVDHWLPSFGYPLRLTGLGADWRYDPDTITVFSQRRQRAEPYTETGVLPEPDPGRLRAAGPAGGTAGTAIDPRYLDTGGVDPRVTELSRRLTAGAGTAFDATIAVHQWFTQPGNGFRYDLRTAPGHSGDALVDFLFTGRTGYCEQFASAMAIMLRTLGVPARVVVGFTPGTPAGDDRVITTADAHAWVEAWFPGNGWLPFDPTPLTDGRSVVPGYRTGPAEPSGEPPPPAARQAPAPLPAPPDRGTGSPPDPVVPGDGPGTGTRIGTAVAGMLVLAGLTGLTPLAVRVSRRRRRLRLVRSGGPVAASAAWAEVLAESADRGVPQTGGETVRATAQRLGRAHALDEPGMAGLRTLVDVVERSWYGGGHPGSGTPGDEVPAALDAVRSSLVRCDPTAATARLLPRSVLRQWCQRLRLGS
jgi:transglutaminase-like putative cysteine protease